ncbi:MAG: YafY family transcriptional regulator [Firmicutes bacterium]|nr:YafY family transcriptional regulator [Bacillota bacterium]
MQQSVVFGILLTLLNKKQVTRQYLAEKFEISVRTVQRYLNILMSNNIPIDTKPGKEGGVWIYSDYCLEKGFLTNEERFKLIECIKSAYSIFADPVHKTLLEKIEQGERNANLRTEPLKTESFFIDVGGWANPNYYRTKLAIFNNAISNLHKISFDYKDQYCTKTSRTVHPYTLVLKDGAWYLFAYCEMRGSYRLFRLSRIVDITTLDETFEKNDDIKVADHLTIETDNGQDIYLCIEFSNLVRSDIEEWLGSEAIIQNELTYTAQTLIYGDPKLVSKILSFGSDIKVISPLSLRQEIRKELDRLYGIYQQEDSVDDCVRSAPYNGLGIPTHKQSKYKL